MRFVVRQSAVPVLAAVLVWVSGCSAPPPADVPLVIDRGERPDETHLRWNVPIEIDGDTRVAITASKPVVIDPEILDTEVATQKTLSGPIPDHLNPVPTVLLGPANVIDGNPVAIRVWPMVPAQMHGRFRIPVNTERVTPGQKPSVGVWPVPALEGRDLETKPLKVPAGAVLRVSIGLEPQCLAALVLPVGFAVTAFDASGNAVPIGSEMMSPAAPDGRHWKDVSYPLEAVAGKEMRFRFSARVAGPVQLQYALPLFSEPSVVTLGG